MTIDPQLIAALEAAVDGDPTNATLRLHLAGILVESDGDATRALHHAQAVLAVDPSNADAVVIAVRAARALRQSDLADGYERLAHALGAPVAPASVASSAPVASDGPEADSGSGFDAELEALLRNEAEDAVDFDAPALTLADVAGMDGVKAEIERTFIGPMRNPELRKMYRTSLRGGLLLYGPPGCGKTFLARAIAGELDATFLSVGLADVLDMYVGQSERKIHEVFARARLSAPCVLFLDEVDALGQKRSNLARSAVRNAVVQLLTELDGIDEQNEGLFVLGATNQPWDVDPALRRPGRFDRTVLVVPPDASARAEIFKLHLRDRPVELVDVAACARRTERFSGADIRLVCETAAELAIQDSIATGRARPIVALDIDRAISMTTPSTLPWFDTARNFVTFANPSGEYDVLLQYMRTHQLL
jgi:SpoVK/Ycf46/Vps4 family AAA+-type ATPase